MPKNYTPSMRLARLTFLLGAVEFLVRAVGRVTSNWLSDLAAPYTSARLWMAGANPYDSFRFLPAWYAGGATNLGLSPFISNVHSVYPPPTLLLVSPLALLRWPAAVTCFALFASIAYAAVVRALVRLAWPEVQSLKDAAGHPSALLFIAITLGFAPIHTAFRSLNIVLFAACFAILATVQVLQPAAGTSRKADDSRTAGRSAFLVGAGVTAAILLKPTTGIFLLPWLAKERRWRTILAVFLACTLLSGAAMGLLIKHQGMSWLPDYRQNIDLLFAHGGNADVSAENTENTDRIDLQLVGFALFNNRTLATLAAALTYLVLLFLFLKAAGWRASLGSGSALDLPLLVAAGCLALGLLPSYTRMYAAIVLLPLVLWCFTHLQLSAARWMLVLLSDFLVNSSAIVRKLGELTGILARAPRLWDFTIGGHTCWILLAIGTLLPLAARQQIAGRNRNATLPAA